MNGHPTPLDISNIPDLVRIVEKVEATKKPLELQKDNKIVAVLMPSEKKRTTSILERLCFILLVPKNCLDKWDHHDLWCGYSQGAIQSFQTKAGIQRDRDFP